MWFGDLVTMRWWNDLWLNESFAEWASTTCQAEATHWTEAWTTFGTHEKTWAYRQDQLPSTHPIVADIRDLEDVEVNFDGITYAKGAAVLKQLVAYVGREPFVDGLRDLLREARVGQHHARRPADRARGHLRPRPRTWSDLWLKTAGVNTLRPDVDTDDRRRHHLGRHRCRPPPTPTRRCARTASRSACYAVEDGKLVRIDRHRARRRRARAPRCPSWSVARSPTCCWSTTTTSAYAKIRLDERSLRHAAGAHRRLRREPAPVAGPRCVLGHDPRRRDARPRLRRPAARVAGRPRPTRR